MDLLLGAPHYIIATLVLLTIVVFFHELGHFWVARRCGVHVDVFSIGFGRLAWVSPPGQGGEGSRIQIAAWTANEVGAIESIPVEGAIVIQ